MFDAKQPSDSFIPKLSRNEARSDLSWSFSSVGESREFSASSSALTPLCPQPRWSTNPDGLKIDKLSFGALSLYGRDQELDILNKSVDCLSSAIVERHLILISGESGTGKSALAHSLKSRATKLNGLYIKGKFDFKSSHEPYSGIVLACVEMCAHISFLQEKSLTLFQNITQRIKEELGSELSLLITFIPSLMEVIDYKDEGSAALVPGHSSEESKNRFQFAFQRLIRIMSDEFAPVILVLDDLQWADASSLDLLDVCLSDSMIKKFMIIGTYRSSEVDQTHILQDAIARFKVKCKGEVVGMTQLSIENLDVGGVNKIIGVVLSMDEAKTMSLAQVCHKKTLGNPFFVLQFLQMLRTDGLLNYDYGSFSWKWNSDNIESIASAANNVVDLLKAKMSYLPKHLLEILKIAACLGSTFNEMFLRIIFENSSSVQSFGEEEDADVLMSGLEYLEQDGYIIRHRNGSSLRSSDNFRASVLSSQAYSWTHDKIHEAAIMLIPTEERALFRRNAGEVLLAKLGTASREFSIFVLVNLLNGGEVIMDRDEDRLILAGLNHDASLRALSISAFQSVADYAGKGIKLLPSNHWNDHYDLSLSLYSIAAQAEGFNGNVDLMEQYCNAVLSQTTKPYSDKMGVYHTLINSLIAKGRTEDAANRLFDILEMCKCRFPKHPVAIKAGIVQMIFKIKSIMKTLNPDDLEESNQSMMLELMRLMDRLAQCLYVRKDPRLPLVIFRILDLTVKQGHTAYSSVAFATTGLMMTGILNDFKGGAWFGENALMLMEKSKSKVACSRTRFLVYNFVFVWTKALTVVLKPLLLSYNEGLNSGDKETAGFCAFYWLVLRFMAGNPLLNLAKDAQLYSTQFKICGMKFQAALLSVFHQTVLKIMDPAEKNCTGLIGTVVSEEDCACWYQDVDVSPTMFLWEGVLSTYFGDHVRHAMGTIQRGHDYLQKRRPATSYIPLDAFLKGISCFAAARETGKVKFSKVGEKLRSKIQKWREMGNPNVIHYESFLDAESAALKKNKTEAIRHYEKTIICAGRTGFLQDTALACERLAEFYLKVMGDEKEASYRLSQSLGYWREWGALAKVEALEKKYGNLCQHNLIGN